MYSVVLLAALATTPSSPGWHHGCHGCYGCYGCYGGCYGCYGGCYGCWGGCYGGYSCCGCCGGGYGGCYGGCYGCYGGYGCGGCYGSAYAPVYGAPAGAPVAPAEAVPAPKKEDKKETSLDRAKLVVELPSDARLFIDDHAMKTASDRRTFNTPALEPGQAYYYMVRAEVVRDGKTYRESKRVIVRAGQVAQTNFTDLVAARNLVEKAVQTAGR